MGRYILHTLAGLSALFALIYIFRMQSPGVSAPQTQEDTASNQSADNSATIEANPLDSWRSAMKFLEIAHYYATRAYSDTIYTDFSVFDPLDKATLDKLQAAKALQLQRSDRYPSILDSLDTERAKMAALKLFPEFYDKARQHLLRATNELFALWYGTPWEFYGASKKPQEGAIACGHYVSGILDDLGFNINRLELGQQASENIILTMTGEENIRRFRNVHMDTFESTVNLDYS